MSVWSLPATHALLAAAAVAFGSTVQGSVGFGMALVAAPVLLLIDRAFVPGPLLAAALVLAILIAHRERRSVDLRGLQLAVVGRVLGTSVAAAVLAIASKGAFDVVLGVLVLLAAGLSGLGLNVSPSRRNVLVAGALSGFMGTVSSIGGPPIALVYQRADGPRLRGTLSGFFVVGSGLSLVTVYLVGHFGLREFALTLALLPGVALGFVVSARTAKIADGRWIRVLVLGLSSAAAVIVLARALV